MTDGRLDEKAIFDVARKIDSEEVRTEYLKQVCGGDQGLFDAVMFGNLIKGP